MPARHVLPGGQEVVQAAETRHDLGSQRTRLTNPLHKGEPTSIAGEHLLPALFKATSPADGMIQHRETLMQGSHRNKCMNGKEYAHYRSKIGANRRF